MNNFDIYRLIHAGGPTITIEPKSITENGVYTAAEGTAFSPVTVDVPQPSGSVSITENGTVDVTDYESAVVNVPNPSTGSISITENGTVDVTDYANAVVNVPNPSTGNINLTPSASVQTGIDVSEKATASVDAITKELLVTIDPDFVAGNIKKDVDILGLVGTFEGSGGGITEHGVFFLDYDGTVLDAWASADVASKTALPDNPTNHPRLVGQGWNWSLANIKSYVQKYPNSDVYVGQMYKTASGLTEIDITLTKVTGLTVNCYMVGNKNWGDGTTDSLTSHTYTTYGDYVITCDGTSVPDGDSSSGGMFGSSSSNVHRFYCTAIRLGENVTSIGEYAFNYCSSFASISISDGVTSIVDYAFNYCYALTSISIPDGVTNTGPGAFYGCYSLASITIPDGVTSIGDYAFNYCSSLASISIPDGVTSIGSSAFDACYSLASITIPDGVTSIGTFRNCYSLTSITIPDGVTSIGSSPFSDCYSLTSITIPDGVTSIVDYAFSYCYSLASITIPDGVTSIGSGAFNYCYSLTSISIPDGVTSIGSSAFSDCYSITSISIPDGVTSIDGSAFSNCSSLASITIPDGVTSIDGSAFSNCSSLTSITIPGGVTSIGSRAFYGCYSLTEYDFSSAVSVPTLSNKNAFTGINGICKILVPSALYDTWIAATNWSTYANYIYAV